MYICNCVNFLTVLREPFIDVNLLVIRSMVIYCLVIFHFHHVASKLLVREPRGAPR